PGPKGSRNFSVAVPARVLSTGSAINRTLAIAGLGVTLAFDFVVRDALASGKLVRVLERYCEPFPGYYLYYPQRRHASPALRAFIDHLRARKRPATRMRKG
ncbi:MAG TPA: LysR substrate-binding domain-containing protein, partial [Gemmatimonadaceae bacterium]